jgi:RIO kinase 1
MRIPENLEALIDEGVVDSIVRPLLSGKEAQVYLVVAGGEERVAKVYKEAQNRTFKNRAEYTEGRQVRNSRDQRAMAKRTRHGKAQDEAAWRSTEVDMIYRLQHAGVRVPVPHDFIDGVLIMELVCDAHGNPAPRLGELTFTRDEAIRIFDRLLAEVLRMLCAGAVHGDLSEFNVLMSADGPVIIDFPQAVNAAGNQNAKKLLLRDVDNLHRFVERFAPGRQRLPYAQEMWQLYERGELTPTTKLSGRHAVSSQPVATKQVMSLIEYARHEEKLRRQALGETMPEPGASTSRSKRRRRRRRPGSGPKSGAGH